MKLNLSKIFTPGRSDEAKFKNLEESKKFDDAEKFAEARIAGDRRKSFWLQSLMKLYSKQEKSERVLALYEAHSRASAFKTYPPKLAIAKALVATRRHEEAGAVLLQLMLESNFVMPMQLYRQLPADILAVDIAFAAFARSQRSTLTKASQAGALADIAVAGGQISRAENIMFQALNWLDVTTFASPPKKRATMSAENGNAALGDLHAMLMPEIPFFLISGTLLGVIREGRLLGHDKDIDVGVMGVDRRMDLKQRVAESGTFKSLYIPSEDIIKLKHANGVNVDIFFHYNQGGRIWHGSHLHAWDNSVWWSDPEPAFVGISYCGKEFLVPSDSDKYLTENYGDWRTPVTDYDASLEAPNRRIRNEELTRIHWQKLIVRYFLNGEFGMLSKAVDIYAGEFGVDRFIRKASRLFLFRDPSWPIRIPAQQQLAPAIEARRSLGVDLPQPQISQAQSVRTGDQISE